MSVFKPRCTEKILVMMSDLFNKIYADGTNTKGQPVDVIVPVRIATTARMIAFWRVQSERVRVTLPLISISVTSMDFDEQRTLPLFHKITSADSFQAVMNPVPYNFTIDVGILCKTKTMLFDIVEQILPKYRIMRAYPLVEFKFKDGSEIKRDIPVSMTNGSFDIKEDVDFSQNEDELNSISFTFLVKGWIYPAINFDYLKGGDSQKKLIEEIDIDFENEYARKYESLKITESTGGDKVVEVTSHI